MAAGVSSNSSPSALRRAYLFTQVVAASSSPLKYASERTMASSFEKVRGVARSSMGCTAVWSRAVMDMAENVQGGDGKVLPRIDRRTARAPIVVHGFVHDPRGSSVLLDPLMDAGFGAAAAAVQRYIGNPGG